VKDAGTFALALSREAQGLPYILVRRELSREEWEKKYCPKEPEASP